MYPMTAHQEDWQAFLELLMSYSDTFPFPRAMVGDPCPPVASCACRATRSSGFGAGHLFGIILLIKGASDGQPTQELQFRSACVFQGELWKVESFHDSLLPAQGPSRAVYCWNATQISCSTVC